MDTFDEKAMERIRPTKNTWYVWLSKYILEPISNVVGGLKDKTVSLFNTNTPKQTVYGKGKKLSKPKTQMKSKENKSNSIRKKKKKKKNYRWNN